MRWHVHGTDSVTGEDLELAVNGLKPEQAVKAAIDRRIVVSHVTAESAYGLRRAVKPLLGLTVLGLIAGACWLVNANVTLRTSNGALRDKLEDAIVSQRRLAQSVATAEQATAKIRARGNVITGTSEEIRKLQDDLAAARSRMSLTEQQLSSTHQQRNEMEAAAARLPEVETQAAIMSHQVAALLAAFNESEKQAGQLRRELVAQQASLEAANGELEKLKQELLVAIAKANMPVMVDPAESAPAPSVMPWALRVSYDAARSFLALNTDPPTVATRAGGLSGPAGERVETTAGALADNAVRMRFVHDKEKGHVFTATMILSVAADAPREKAAENVAMMREFLREFVPGIPDAGGIVTAAVGQAKSLSEERRALFLVQDCRVTAWTSKEGLLTLQVEAGQEEE